jgi:glycosyltransferase involved in cell wall biosynthesis
MPLIDAWVIVDTGSDDGTQGIIREVMQDIQGKLYERPWVDFSHNRTEALELAKGRGDFALVIDADEQVIYEEGFVMPDLTEPFYMIEVHLGLLSAFRELLLDNRLNWYWEGVLHEQVRCRDELKSYGTIKNAYNLSTMDSSRNLDPQKFAKEAETMEKGLLAEPNNSRYVFYLGHTYAALGDWAKALQFYERRSCMGEWHQEVYHSLYRIGFMQEMQKQPPQTIIESYAKAHQFMPMRAEPLFRLAYQH